VKERINAYNAENFRRRAVDMHDWILLKWAFQVPVLNVILFQAGQNDENRQQGEERGLLGCDAV
jgi:hypothetical protein